MLSHKHMETDPLQNNYCEHVDFIHVHSASYKIVTNLEQKYSVIYVHTVCTLDLYLEIGLNSLNTELCTVVALKCLYPLVTHLLLESMFHHYH